MTTGPQVAPSLDLNTGISLYVHVPFCKTKCPYCDFNTYQGIESLMGSYLEALLTELRLWGRVLGSPAVNTVFFGGGTPSYLPAGYIGRMLAVARESFRLKPEAEITIEANPGDLDIDACRRLLAGGVNRLSIGVQSLDDGLLALLGRRHSAEGAIAAYRTATSAGFTNVNLDLMYGLPQQSMVQWENTVGRLLAERPAHISLYCLTLEEGTPLHQWVRQGKLPEPDPDLAADMYHYAEDSLEREGYHHYEISNWSLPGLAAKHNLVYWLNRPYLGVGPGAHSCLGRYRFWDVSSPRAYISRVREWEESQPQLIHSMTAEALGTVLPVAGQEYINTETACAEAMFLGLRLLDGLDLAAASARLGVDLAARYRTQIEELVDLDLLEREDGRLRLTRPAYLIANRVFEKFLG